MTEFPINLANLDDDTDRVVQRVESVLTSHGLTMRSRGSLKQYPGSIHWHFTNGEQRGTLEVTLWAVQRRLWFKVQAARHSAWIDQLVPVLKEALEKG